MGRLCPVRPRARSLLSHALVAASPPQCSGRETANKFTPTAVACRAAQGSTPWIEKSSCCKSRCPRLVNILCVHAGTAVQAPETQRLGTTSPSWRTFSPQSDASPGAHASVSWIHPHAFVVAPTQILKLGPLSGVNLDDLTVRKRRGENDWLVGAAAN